MFAQDCQKDVILTIKNKLRKLNVNEIQSLEF